MRAVGLAIAGAAALITLTACGSLDPTATGGAGGGNAFCAAFGNYVTVAAEQLPTAVNGDKAAQKAAEAKVQAAAVAVVSAAPAEIKADIAAVLTDAQAGRSETGARAGTAGSKASERVAEYTTRNCAQEGLKLLKDLGNSTGIGNLLPRTG